MTNVEKQLERRISSEADKVKNLYEEDHTRFFTRRETIKYFADSVYMVGNSNGYTTSLSVTVDPKGEDIAYTNGRVIHLCPKNDFFKGLSLSEHVECLLGICTHELSHILYTDFKLMEDISKAFDSGKILFEPVSKDTVVKSNLKKLKASLKDATARSVITSIFFQFHNVLEDGYIEDNFLKEFNGELADALCFAREHQFYHFTTIPKMREEIIDKGFPRYTMLHNLLLEYSKYGCFLCDSLKELDCEEVRYMEKLFPTIDAYMELPHRHFEEKYMLVTELMCRAWDIIEEYISIAKMQSQMLEALADLAKENAKSGISMPMPVNAQSAGDMNDDDDEESESGENSSSNSNGSGRSAAAQKTKEDIEKAKSESSEGKDKNDSGEDKNGKAKKRGRPRKKKEEGNDGEGKSNEGIDETGEEKGKEGENGKDGKDGTDKGDDTPERIHPTASSQKTLAQNDKSCGKKTIVDVLDEEAGRIDNQVDGEAHSEGEGRIEHVSISSSGYSAAASDIENLINTVSRIEAKSHLEADLISRAKRDAGAIKLSGIHQNVNFYVNRISEVTPDMKAKYNQVSEPLLKISKLLQKAVAKRLKEVRMGNKNNNLLVGKKLMSNALYRVDGRIFSSTKLPQPNKLAVGILIDESGSMCGNNRATSARATAIILEDFCRGLGIPCCIYGHTDGQHGRGGVDMYSYVSFDNIDGDDRYRLMDISARCGNRDGAALMFVGNQMLKRPEENKIIILVSDGQPAADGYYGQPAEEDLRSIKKQFNRAGIPLFAAAIGEDKENIHRIYGDGFMDISDLNEMPKILANLITKFCKL